MADNRYFEVTVIINGALEEEAIAQTNDRIAEFITRNGGSVRNADHWGRKRLAYPINKKHTGYYIQYAIDAAPDFAALLDRFFRIDESVIRHLILSLDENDLKKREEMKARLEAAEAEEEAAAAKETEE